MVNVMGSISGVIDSDSLETIEPFDQWQDKFHKGDKLLARVLMVDTAEKNIRFSLRPHIISLSQQLQLPPLGATIEDLNI